MFRFLAQARSFAAHEEGANFAEYVLLCVLIAVLCIGVLTLIGSGVRTLFVHVPAFG